jgi:type IV secretion system protein VirD4
MIAVLCVLVLAAAAARIAAAELGAYLPGAAAGFLAFALALLAAWAVLKRALFPGRELPRNRVRAMRRRTRLGLRPGPGHATGFECWWQWGRGAAFRRSRRARRSLPAWRRYIWPAEHSMVAGWAYLAHCLRIPFEEHVLVLSPPRAGKTGWLAKVLLRWPGPAVATSTKGDLLALSGGVRARMRRRAAGSRIEVFNPQSIGGIPSTFRWNPLDGCDVPSVAMRRADAFAHAVSQKGVEDGGFFGSKASGALRAYFHAAGLAGYDLSAVSEWVLSGDTETAAGILRGRAAAEFTGSLRELASEAQKTAVTIRMVMSSALNFMADPILAASVLPGHTGGLDIAKFLASNSTLYMVAEAAAGSDEAPVAALFSCLVSEIRYQATLLGSSMPGARLDPPLLLALDECTQICPCPIPSWLADSGGKGISIVTVGHGEAQLAVRWGEHGAATIWDTSGTKMLFGGITAQRTLDVASKLCGDTAYTEHGQEHSTRHLIMTDAMVRQIPGKRALLIRADLSPVIARIPAAWRDIRYVWARVRGYATVSVQPPAAAVRPVPASPFVPVDGNGNGHSNGNGTRPVLAAPSPPAQGWWDKPPAAGAPNGNGSSNGHGAGGASDGH